MERYLRALLDAGAELYEVGGPVRDRFLNRTVKDHDYLVRHLTVQQLQKLLAPFGRTALVGKSFGVVKFNPFGVTAHEIDFALPRVERSTGTGHRDFDVDFDPELPVTTDLGRRDFTINAMAQSIVTDELIDPFGGKNDLDHRVLRQVFPQAFIEDPLRLLRAVQFAARFALTIEPVTWEAMRAHAALIATVSPERMATEFKKLLDAETPSRGFILMRDAGLLPHCLPELAALVGIEQDKMPGDDVFLHTMRVLDAARRDEAIEHAGDLDLLVAALLHDIGKAKTARYHEESKRVVFFGHQIVSKKLAARLIERLKLTTIGVNPARVTALIEHHMFETKAFFTDRAIRRFVSKVSPELIMLLVDLRIADNRGGKHPGGIKGVAKLKQRIAEEMAKKPPFGAKDLALNGHDLMGMGIPEGPRIGAVLAGLVDLVLDNPELNTREQLTALAMNMKDAVPTPREHAEEDSPHEQGNECA